MATVDIQQSQADLGAAAGRRWAAVHDRQVLAVAGSVGVGAGLVVLAYHMAFTGQTSFAHYDVFWVGMFLIFGSLAWLLSRPGLGRRAGGAILAVAGLAAYFPRFMRAPTKPYMNDELGHWMAAERMFRTSKLYLPDVIVHQAAHYVGLETLTVGLRELTGLSTWRVATVILACFHVLTLLGIFQLVRQTVDDRAALIAAFLYALSPSFSFFDSMYAYESFAVPLMVWVLAAAATAVNEQGSRRRAWIGIGVVLGAACVVTHHLVSFAMILGLAVLAASQYLTDRRRRDGVRNWPGVAALAASLVALATFWAWNRHAGIVGYLDVYPREGIRALIDRFTGSHSVTIAAGGAVSAGGGRALFSNARIPWYEPVATYLSQPLLLGGYLLGLWRRRHRLGGSFGLLAAFGLAYFVSLPLLLTSAGQAGVHRTWTIWYVGLVGVIAVGVEPLLRAPAHRLGARRGLLACGVLILLVGGYGSQNNWLEVFPGPAVYQGDGRVMSNELVNLATWFEHHEGRGQVVMADRLTNVAFAAYAESVEAPAALDWQTFFPTTSPNGYVVGLDRSHVNFIVVDKRMATTPPENGAYFDGNYEPPVAEPLPAASIDKFNHLAWLQRIHETQHYVIYKVIP